MLDSYGSGELWSYRTVDRSHETPEKRAQFDGQTACIDIPFRQTNCPGRLVVNKLLCKESQVSGLKSKLGGFRAQCLIFQNSFSKLKEPFVTSLSLGWLLAGTQVDFC